MEEKWYDGLSDDALLTEENRKYKEAVEKIKDVVKKGMGFDKACDSLNIEDEDLRKTIIDDALKLLIADMHFVRRISTERVAEILQISVERVNAARKSMLEEVKDAAIKEFRRSIDGYGGRSPASGNN